MESAERELMGVLLGRVCSLGLISKDAYSKAMDLVHSMTGLPVFFRDPACLTEEAGVYECAENPQ